MVCHGDTKRPMPAAALLMLLGSASMLATLVGAQDIKLVSKVGCADLPPSPPQNLLAKAGDGSVTLTWSKPANGACVSEYQVRVVPVDPSQRSFLLPPQSTPDFTLTIAELTNGQAYRFFVKAFAAKYNGGGEAQAVATPMAPCSPTLLPSAPTKLTASPGTENVTLCWGLPANGGCVDEYRVAIRVAQQNGQKSNGATMYRRYNKGGCVTISQLTAGVLYEFSVQSYSAPLKGGAYATVLSAPVAPAKAWRCIPVTGYYPLCSVAAAGRCMPLTCAQQLAKGQCAAPFMRIVDKKSLSIVQHCAEVCGCSTDPTLDASTATAKAAPTANATVATTASGSDAPTPRVQKFDGGVTETSAAAMSQANAAAENAVTRGQLSWMSADGCCAAPPRARYYGEEDEDDFTMDSDDLMDGL